MNFRRDCMVPVFIGFQLKRALRTAVVESTSDITKKKLMACIMEKLQIELVDRRKLSPIKNVTQDDMTLSIELAPEMAQTMVICEQGRRWTLIIKKNSEENQTEFIFDTHRKINITFG